MCVGVLERKNLRLCIHKCIDVCGRGGGVLVNAALQVCVCA